MIRSVILFLIMLTSSVVGQEQTHIRDPNVDKRVALVIGNGGYLRPEERLPNPTNDAKAIADRLRSLNFDVIEAIDLNYEAMRETLGRFDRALKGADAGLFFYAGHGMEYQGNNYLFPTNAVLETEGDVRNRLIDLKDILHVMESTVPTRILFLDACRNNPLAGRFRSTLGATRSLKVGTGLSRIDASVGTFIAYATAPGELAEDGVGNHSPFSSAMLKHLDEPGLDIAQLMRRIRSTVFEATEERQIPWNSSSLRSSFFLNPHLPELDRSDSDLMAERFFWQSIEISQRISDYEAYLEQYGDDGLYAALARGRIRELQQDIVREDEGVTPFDAWKIQQALADLGFDIGVVDGQFGPRTKEAVKDWQESQGEAPTGDLSAGQPEAILDAWQEKLAELTPEPEQHQEPEGEFDDKEPRRSEPCDVCPEMVLVSGGRFLMGSLEGRHDERPQHEVDISDFAVSIHEITVGQWAACVADRQACPAIEAHRLMQDNEPANNVSWDEARLYTAWLSSKDNQQEYRLPSEAEWEYAASRRGTWRGWRHDDSIALRANAASTIGGPTAVGSYKVEHSGVYDLFGNVAEWVQDCWNDGYSGAPPDGTAWLQGDCSYRVVRGGSYSSQEAKLRLTARDRQRNKRLDTVGFRVVTSMDQGSDLLSSSNAQ